MSWTGKLRYAPRHCWVFLDLAWTRSNLVVEGIRSGSADSEHEFAERFLPRLRSFFRARTGSADWVEELTQEAVLAALIALRAGRLRDAAALEGFVLGIARRQLAEAYRREAKDSASALGDEIESVPAGPQLAPEWTLAVRGELAGLDAVNRRILWMILIEGLRPREVADLVGMTEVAVRQRKSRLLRTMAAKFGVAGVTDATAETTRKVAVPPEGTQ